LKILNKKHWVREVGKRLRGGTRVRKNRKVKGPLRGRK